MPANTDNIILIGGGGHCRSVIEVAESSDRTIYGILDLPDMVGNTISGYPIIGTDDDIELYVDKFSFLVSIGNIKLPDARINLHNKVLAKGGNFISIVANSAIVSKRAKIGDGTVIMHLASVNANVEIGFGCIINTAANIEHDVKIGDYCHVSTGAMVNGSVSIGNRCFIGSGAVICNNISIVDNCVIGAGTVVTEDICEPGTYVGIPAKKIK